MDLTTPTFLPNGQSLWVDHDFYRRLHYGDASIGWNGDLRLGVYHSGDRLEIWRDCEDGEMRLVMRSRPGHKSLDTAALVFLAAHDSQRRGGFDVKEHVDSHNAAIKRDRERHLEDKTDAAIDKLHWALLRDAAPGGLRRRMTAMPAAPWLKKGQ